MRWQKKQVYVRGEAEIGSLPELLKRHPHAKQMLGIIGEAEAQLAIIIGLNRNQIALEVNVGKTCSRIR